MAAYKETLRRLALNDEGFLQSALGIDSDTVEGFHVALTSANPSLLMRLSRGFD